MGGFVTTSAVSVDEYLTNPAFEHHEYVNGEVVALNVGTRQHARIQMKCAYEMTSYLKSHPDADGGTELHCRLMINGEIRFRLPDVALVLNGTSPEARYLEGAPDLVIEIRSPEDTIASLFRKMTDYFANGAKLGWIILPEEESVFVLSPSDPVRTFAINETLEGGDAIPGLSIPVSSLFA